jgi:signal transduction histidine kinase
MGLGLFLTRAVLARLGGRLDIESAPARGTTVILVLPRAPALMRSSAPEAANTQG